MHGEFVAITIGLLRPPPQVEKKRKTKEKNAFQPSIKLIFIPCNPSDVA